MHDFQAVREGGSERYLQCNLEQRGLQRYSGLCVPAVHFMMMQFQRDCTFLAGIAAAECNEQVLHPPRSLVNLHIHLV